MTLRVGLQRVPITPPIGIMQIGYFARNHGCEYVHDDLYATALVLDDGLTKLAWVTCDLLFLHAESVARIRQEVAQRTDIPAEHIMLSCSHTHSGPIPYAGPAQAERDHHYTNGLVYQIAGAICAARGRLEPARLGFGRSEAHISANRRERRANGQVVLGTNPAGPVDPEVGVLRIDRADGSPLAVLVNYACHAVALSAANYGISADWPGAMRSTVEGATGATCLFVQGGCADINPVGGPQPGFERVRQLGQAVGGAAIQAWAEIQGMTDQVALSALLRPISLPLLGPLDAAGKPVVSVQEVAETRVGMPWAEYVRARAERFPWKAIIQEDADSWRIAAELQTFRIGDIAVAAVPVEPFVEIGLHVKARAALPRAIFAGYSNGLVGYLPTASAYDIGGYEVDLSYIYYHLPAPLSPTCAQQIEDTLAGMIAELA